LKFMKNQNAILVFPASALVGSLAPGARAQTTINTIGATIGTGQVYDLNLNGDGSTNFAIRFDGKSSTDTTTWNKTTAPFVSARPQDTTDATQDTYVLGNLDAAQSANTVGFPLAGPGATIGPGYLTAGGVGYLYQDYNGNTVGGWSSTSISDGYVGLELVSGGGSVTNFGWVEIAYNYNGGTGSTIDVLRDAFDDTPNDSLTTPATVPEPSTLALAGLAATGLAFGLRIRFKQHA
jgi:hypothetical protein